jgi:hypothetical protein
MLCRYAITRGTFPLTFQIWEDVDAHDQGSTRDSAQVTNIVIRREDQPRC